MIESRSYILFEMWMPTVIKIGAFRFYSFSNESGEPPHIHIQSDRKLAKFWLDPVTLAKSTRFSSKELRKIEKIVMENENLFLEVWNEYFNKSRIRISNEYPEPQF